ncbi:hypothetical protein DDZ14_17840 [Maritimibacter sp. 55A14]|uniref:hypothetical protein n=1 Tax=Maritimibacter sp. 55A14 TaxID=2174844 RepID=UPI000D612DB0|nr:hypothetical protein [Maritimibacter sp. 55A14]PWE29295.1 hypothetical protein DDZ14_17840 [Maritimibacter sp. 55A14]
MLRLMTICLLLLPPGIAGADAWPRGKGQVFAAAKLRLPNRDTRHSGTRGVFAEYGLTDKLTLGAEQDQGSGARVFLRWAKLRPGGLVTAQSFGLAESDNPYADVLVETGLHAGYGWESRLGAGWISLDSRFSATPQGIWDHAKLDLLAGVKPVPRLMTMLSVETHAEPGATFVNLVPSLAWRLFPVFTIQARYRTPLHGGAARQIEFALWTKF